MTLKPQNHVTLGSRISQDHSLYQVWTLWNHPFLSYAPNKQVRKALFEPATLTFELSIPKNYVTSRISQGHSLHQGWPFLDLSFLSYAADKQMFGSISPGAKNAFDLSLGQTSKDWSEGSSNTNYQVSNEDWYNTDQWLDDCHSLFSHLSNHFVNWEI